MYRELLADATFHNLLLACDRDLADRARAMRCRQCGGALHAAPYARTAVAAPSTTTSFDQPFPMAGLTTEAFERSCAAFLQKRYWEAKGKVHRVGGSGHDQDGLDIEVVLPDKSRIGFQCKREQEFGPQRVHATVGQYKGDAKEKIILLARVASPWPLPGGLRDSLIWLEGNPAEHGLALRPGALVLAGTALGLYPVAPGEHVVVSLDRRAIAECFVA